MEKRLSDFLMLFLVHLTFGSEMCDLDSPSSETCRFRSSCQPVKSIAFLKTHKCASSTVGNILVRYGLRNRLRFYLPKYDDAHIGWPESLIPEHVLVPGSRASLLVHHSVYNRTTLKHIMPRDTVYVSIVREPFSHFKSVINYFHEISQLGFKAKDRVYEFLSNPYRYEKPVTVNYGSGPKQRSLTKNFLSSEFGLTESSDDEFQGSPASLSAVIDEFDLVMIKEHFYESIVLLKRLLCWDLEDMLFLKLNKYFYERPAYEDVQKRLHKDWSPMDYSLYEYANQTFWRKIAQQEPDFFDEVGYFRLLNRRVQEYCKKAGSEPLRLKASRWHGRFEIGATVCEEMKLKPGDMYGRILRNMYSWTQRIWISVYHVLLGW